MRRISHVSRLLLVVLAVLVCQGAVAQSDFSRLCCIPGFLPGEMLAAIEPGTPPERVEAIALEFGVQIKEVGEPNSAWTLYVFCVPIGEESAFAAMFDALPEVRFAQRTGRICAPLAPPCDCCPCPLEGCLFVPPCEAECELDADSDTFADTCDTCTDTDQDGFGDPEFGYDFFGRLIRTCPIDNCSDTANPDQADLDADGIGDACDSKLTICHRPPGKPAGAHTIDVSLRAFPAHLAHGDLPGACVARR